MKTAIDESLPSGKGDERRITQALLNLVGNAIKFTEAGEVAIKATAANGAFHVAVIDTGPGIPLEHQQRIFGEFQQIDSSSTRKKGGTGLGLAIAQQLAQSLGGRLSLSQREGGGLRAALWLPAQALG